jgi:hypothetical protein
MPLEGLYNCDNSARSVANNHRLIGGATNTSHQLIPTITLRALPCVYEIKHETSSKSRPCGPKTPGSHQAAHAAGVAVSVKYLRDHKVIATQFFREVIDWDAIVTCGEVIRPACSIECFLRGLHCICRYDRRRRCVDLGIGEFSTGRAGGLGDRRCGDDGCEVLT